MKSTRYEGSMYDIPAHEIYLNITHLDKGNYVLKIIYKNKVVKSTWFTKE
jgi:hypothetical protein